MNKNESSNLKNYAMITMAVVIVLMFFKQVELYCENFKLENQLNVYRQYILETEDFEVFESQGNKDDFFSE